MSSSSTLPPSSALPPSATLSSTFTLYHNGQFCIGILEVRQNGEVQVAQHVFGSVPSDTELYEFLLKHGGQLFDQADRSVPVPTGERSLLSAKNPKRLARDAAKQMKRPAVGTASLQAQKLTAQANAAARKRVAKARREENDELLRAKRRWKAKQRKRGH